MAFKRLAQGKYLIEQSRDYYLILRVGICLVEIRMSDAQDFGVWLFLQIV